jgi:hypothetical protein
MTKTFCDRCGKEIKKVDHTSIYAWITHRALYATLRMIGSKSEEGNWKTVDAYICPECEDSYIHWFMNPEKKAGEAG